MITPDTTVVQNGNGVNSFIFPALTTTGQNGILIAGFHFSNTVQTGVTFSGTLSWNLLGPSLTIPTAGGEIFVYWTRTTQPLNAISFTATFTSGNFPQCSGIIGAFNGGKYIEPIGASNTGTVSNGTSVTSAFNTTKPSSLGVAFTGQTADIAMSPGTGQSEANETTSAGTFSRCHMIYQNSITPASGTSVTMESTAGSNVSMAMYALELIDGTKPSFQKNTLRPRPFAPGIAR